MSRPLGPDELDLERGPDVATVPLDLRNAEVSHYGQSGNGARTVSVRWAAHPGVEVQVRPTTDDHQGIADELARTIASDLGQVSEIRAECRKVTFAATLRRKSAERSVDLMTAPGQRFLGPAYVRPDSKSAWQGRVWLVDPEKGFSGLGFMFDSLPDLWRAMPDLRPMAAGQDETGPWIEVASLQIKASVADHAVPVGLLAGAGEQP